MPVDSPGCISRASRGAACPSSLSGKLTTAILRKLVAAVDLEHRKPADVAAEFLGAAGLKSSAAAIDLR